MWFQNRRMKDKRQRITAAWPYAAVYADPAFAASILQAAANSVAMPFGYPQTNMLNQMPHVMPHHQMQSSAPYSSYGYSRYAPYPIPQRSHNLQSNNSYNMMNSSSLPPGYQPLSLPKSHTPPQDVMRSPSSPSSSLSLSPGSDKQDFSPIPPSAPLLPSAAHQQQHLSHHHHQQGLLITTSSPHSTSSSSSPPMHSTSHPQMLRPVSSPQQSLVKDITEKPKLFKPYKSS